jgi:hypothetical protein
MPYTFILVLCPVIHYEFYQFVLCFGFIDYCVVDLHPFADNDAAGVVHDRLGGVSALQVLTLALFKKYRCVVLLRRCRLRFCGCGRLSVSIRQ